MIERKNIKVEGKKGYKEGWSIDECSLAIDEYNCPFVCNKLNVHLNENHIQLSIETVVVIIV